MARQPVLEGGRKPPGSDIRILSHPARRGMSESQGPEQLQDSSKVLDLVWVLSAHSDSDTNAEILRSQGHNLDPFGPSDPA